MSCLSSFLLICTVLHLVCAELTAEQQTEALLRKYAPYECPSNRVGKTRVVAHTANKKYKTVKKQALKGRVEVCLPTPPSFNVTMNLWGTICSRPDKDTATAMCGSLFYSDIGRTKEVLDSKDIDGVFSPANKNQPLFMNNIVCADRATTNLTECTYDLENDGENACTRDTDLYLHCEERVECPLCENAQSCDFQIILRKTKRCTHNKIYCVRQETIFNDTSLAPRAHKKPNQTERSG